MEEFVEEVVAPATGAVGASMVGMIGMVMMTDLNFQQVGQVARSSVQPGTIGGGGSPTDNNIPTLNAALNLVPSGLTPVAVFPPFAS